MAISNGVICQWYVSNGLMACNNSNINNGNNVNNNVSANGIMYQRNVAAFM
jgi:hypothetical protein